MAFKLVSARIEPFDGSEPYPIIGASVMMDCARAVFNGFPLTGDVLGNVYELQITDTANSRYRVYRLECKNGNRR